MVLCTQDSILNTKNAIVQISETSLRVLNKCKIDAYRNPVCHSQNKRHQKNLIYLCSFYLFLYTLMFIKNKFFLFLFMYFVNFHYYYNFL